MSSPCFPCDVCIESFFPLNIPMTQGIIVAEADPCHQRRYKQDHIGWETRVAGRVRNYAHSSSRMTPAALRKASMPLSQATPATMGCCFCPLGASLALWTAAFHFIPGTQRTPRQTEEGLRPVRAPPAPRAAGLLTPGPARIASSDNQNIGPSSCGQRCLEAKPLFSWDRQCEGEQPHSCPSKRRQCVATR